MHKTLLAACLAALALPGLAHADEHYLRVGAGINELDSPDFDDDSNTWTIGVGWRFSKYFSAETGYNDLGDYVGSAPAVGGPMDLRPTSLELGLAAKIPFGDSGLFGQARAGAHRWENKFHNFETTAKDTGVDPYYGLGLGYDFTDLFGVVLSYERYAMDHDQVGDFDRMMLSFELR